MIFSAFIDRAQMMWGYLSSKPLWCAPMAVLCAAVLDCGMTAHIAGMARLAESIKARGAAAVVQINNAGARCLPVGGDLQGASPSGFAFWPDDIDRHVCEESYEKNHSLAFRDSLDDVPRRNVDASSICLSDLPRQRRNGVS